MTAIGQRFGENLRRARGRAGLSQEAVAVRASLHRTEVSLLERGERLPRLDTAIKVAASAEATLPELLDGIAWEPGESMPGGFTVAPNAQRQKAALERAAEFRARQSEPSDVPALAREAREELERRGRGPC